VILKSLWHHKTRTLLTVVGVAIGVAAIVALSALSEGLLETYGSLAGGSKADMLVAQEEAVDIVFSAVDEKVGPALASVPSVEDVTGMIYTAASTPGTPYFIVFGYDPQGFAIDHFKIVEGQALSGQASRRGGAPLLLGRAAADDLEKGVGDTIRLYQSVYRVVGIYETGQPIEDGAAVVPLQQAQILSKHPHQVNAFLLKLRDLDGAELVRQRIERRFDELTATLSSEFAENQQTIDYVNSFTWAVSFLAIFIGGVGVMNTLLMSVFERTREFGVLRATGWERLRVLGIVLGEAVTLCGIGGLLGAGLGVALILGLRQLPLAGGFLTAEFSPLLLGRGVGVALVLGLVGGVYPAWRASGLTPVEAMRSEGGSSARAARLKVGWVSLRNLLRQPTRTLLTLVGIGIAIMAMVSLGGLGEGITEQMEAFAGGGVHLVGIEAGASMDLSTIGQEKVRRIGRLPQVRHAEGFLTGYAQVGDLPYFVVFGYRPRGQMIRDFEIVEGERLATSRQILIGCVAADSLGRQVGETLRVFDSTFRIVGIYETGVPFEDGGGVISLRTAQDLFGQPRKVSFLGI
jgi:ABC-type antimicrobial peptide transport system permease subunit